MKGIFKIIILIGAVALLYNFRAPVTERVAPVMSDISDFIRGVGPCEEPIAYTLGSFSTEFNLSQADFLKAVSDAEAIWEKAYGKELFGYTTNTSSKVLKINLVYDYRQETTSQLSQIGTQVDRNRAAYENLKDAISALRSDYNTKKTEFNARVASFNTKEEAYSKEVEYWNKRGGAPQAEYERLEQTRRALEAESKTLQTLQAGVNKLADQINAKVAELNQLVKTLNISVENYNDVSGTRGETFEEGVYHSDGRNKAIDVYEFSSRDKLVRVLAHEFGHALGLDHVSDSKAIMYELNQSTSLRLTDADIAALNAICVQAE